LNLALFFANDTIHGIPTCKARPAPEYGFEPSVMASWIGDGISSRRFGGSNAEAGCERRADAVLRELELLDLRIRRGMLTGGGSFVGDDGIPRSDPSEPSRRMIGSMICEDQGVRASGGSSVELEGERTEGLTIGLVIEEGGIRVRTEVLLALEAVEAVRRRAAVAEKSGFGDTGRTGLTGEDSLKDLRV